MKEEAGGDGPTTHRGFQKFRSTGARENMLWSKELKLYFGVGRCGGGLSELRDTIDSRKPLDQIQYHGFHPCWNPS